MKIAGRALEKGYVLVRILMRTKTQTKKPLLPSCAAFLTGKASFAGFYKAGLFSGQKVMRGAAPRRMKIQRK